MSLENDNKINQLFTQWPSNAIYLTSWLAKEGYSAQLLHRYKQSNWIESVGHGAVIKTGDQVSLEGALFAIQKQGKQHIHPGGKTALNLLGRAHYLEFSTENYTLFGAKSEKLPFWCLNYNWKTSLNYYSTSFLPPNIGLVDYETSSFSIKISGAVRALLECFYLAPRNQDLKECYELMEGLNNLRPQQVQQLLEVCTSVKAKRLFLYTAEKVGHAWMNFIDIDKIDMGSGKRQIVKKGAYIPKYKITVPNIFEDG